MADDLVSRLSTHVTRRPFPLIAVLVLVAFCIELAQAVPEVLPAGHALGETVRNVAYGLIGALLFSWLIIEIPAKARRRRSYDALRLSFQTLLTVGPGLLEFYRLAAPVCGVQFDAWRRSSISEVVTKFAPDAVDLAFGESRSGMLRVGIDAIERALGGIAPSVAYLDDDVAHALSRYPRQNGLTMLQIQYRGDGVVQPFSDEHITWTLVEAARELFRALVDSDAYDEGIFEASVGNPPQRIPLNIIDRSAP